MRFIAHDKGDSSVGIFSYTECWVVTTDPERDLTTDEIDGLKEALSSAIDCVVVTEAEWDAAIRAENEALAESCEPPEKPQP